MIYWHLTCAIAAVICFALSAVGVISPRLNIQSLGLLFLVLMFMLR